MHSVAKGPSILCQILIKFLCLEKVPFAANMLQLQSPLRSEGLERKVNMFRQTPQLENKIKSNIQRFLETFYTCQLSPTSDHLPLGSSLLKTDAIPLNLYLKCKIIIMLVYNFNYMSSVSIFTLKIFPLLFPGHQY